MSFLLYYVERFVSYIFYNNRNNEDLMLTRSAAFASLPKPTITVTSPDGGPNNTILKLEHTQDGDDLHPELQWMLPEGLTGDVDPGVGQVRVWEYVVSCEDLDLPLPKWIAKGMFHSLIYSIPGTKTSLTHADATAVPSSSQELRTEGGYRYVPNPRLLLMFMFPLVSGKSYAGAKPLIGHGEHRYLYQVIALNEPLDLTLLGEKPSKAKLAEAIKGKVAGWGVWVARYDRTPPELK